VSDDLASVSVEMFDDVVVVHLAGEVDIANAAAVQASIHEAMHNEASGLVLDLSELAYLDSSGIRLVITLQKQLSARRQQLQIVRTDEGVAARLFALVGLDATLACSTDLPDALAAVRDRRDQATSS
jgi:anti-anti-sigma factor